MRARRSTLTPEMRAENLSHSHSAWVELNGTPVKFATRRTRGDLSTVRMLRGADGRTFVLRRIAKAPRGLRLLDSIELEGKKYLAFGQASAARETLAGVALLVSANGLAYELVRDPECDRVRGVERD